MHYKNKYTLNIYIRHSRYIHQCQQDITYEKRATYGSFMRMKTRHMKNETAIQTNATLSSRIRLSFGVVGLLVWSSSTKPIPPITNRKLDARPSMMN